MSKTAPWLAISCDWTDSDLFDPIPTAGLPEHATDGCRLAWMCLLCWVKMQGRGGKAAFRENAFARRFNLSDRSVVELKKRAQIRGSATFENGVVTIVNWRVYQQKAYKQSDPDYGDSPQTEEKGATKHQAPSTKHQPPPTAAAVLESFGVGKAARKELAPFVTVAEVEEQRGKTPGVIVTALRELIEKRRESRDEAERDRAEIEQAKPEERHAVRELAIARRKRTNPDDPMATHERVEETPTFLWCWKNQRAQLAKLAERPATPVAQAMAGGGA